MLALNTWSFPGYSGISQRIVSMPCTVITSQI